MEDPCIDRARVIRAPRGSHLSCKSWLTEAAFRMIQNNLDPEVAENPTELVVYGGIGRAARNWECYDRILATLKILGDDETLLVQSGKAAAAKRIERVLFNDPGTGVMRHADAGYEEAIRCAQQRALNLPFLNRPRLAPG